MDVIIIAAVIFVFTYILISMNKTPKIRIGRGTAAAIGGALMILFGVVSFTDAFDYISFEVIFLLLGMMMLVAGLEFSGFFQIVSDFLLKRSQTKVKLLAYIMMICAVLSAVVLNDAVVLLFTPIVIKCCKRICANPIPYLIGVMFSANIGSLATSVGNPQNAYISNEAGITFIEFSLHTLPITLICLPIAFAVIYITFRKKLETTEALCEFERTPVDDVRLKAVLAVTAGAFTGFVISGYIGIPLYAIAMTAGILALLIVMTKSTDSIKWVAKRVDWSVLVFFIGLFILMGGVVESGLLYEIASFFPGFGEGEDPSVLGLTAFSAVLSNLVSNVPAVVLIGEMLPAENEMLWITLAAGSTLAGNATLIGSAANIIVAERSETFGISFSFWKFVIIGIPVTIITLLAAVAIITVIF